ncbi:beta-phosphoglucomutase family hydrolase [Streptomyces malaysiensis]|uniref:Beta-phosphoglucomutase family hydrolase n=1 Tax=Streptomyces malaysiensis TaxID=92644 RepID=A0A7X5WWQ4_STRMQ|nr:beta-phosphoglucomutase family hydrolase [Streptomyces malaysiensis]NIY62386.1 beta-phosphoglucomutase family hydrolase [Streptomyces malaysiensis]
MRSPVTLDGFDAVLFDLDGVLTTTAALHEAAWRSTFDTFLDEWDATHGTSTARFDAADYAGHVDGKARQDGVRDFLAARGITLPPGTPDEPSSTRTVRGLGNLKQERFVAELATGRAEAFPGSIAWVREVREAGLKTAVVSSSQNCAEILERVGISNLFDTRVDGQTALEQNLPGKPAPDMFLAAADLLGAQPARCVVVEDALVGVAAGRAGDFGLVIGVDRAGQAGALAEHGADLVVEDLSELLADVTEEVHRSGPRAHRLRAAARRILATGAEHVTDPWRLVERSPSPGDTGRTESLFTVSNGYIGIRGGHEEGEPACRPATLLNGFHETWPIVYPEPAYGLASTGQTVVPVPDATGIRLLVDEEPVNIVTTEVREYERTLNMADGTLRRSVTSQLPGGLTIKIDSLRFVSLSHRHLACVRYDLTILHAPQGQAEPGAPTDLILSSEMVTRPPVVTDPTGDPRRTRSLAEDALRPDGEQADGVRVTRVYRTANSGLAVAAAMDHSFDPATLTHLRTRIEQDRAYVVFAVRAAPGQTVTLTKWLAYHHDDAVASGTLADRAEVTLYRAMSSGYSAALQEHEKEMAAFWADSDVEWSGSLTAQQALRFSLFTLLQGTARSEGRGVPAKGQTGTGYEGHYFWDTEIYLLPFLVHTHPPVARSLLMHRINALPAARERARQVSCDGALFPWRTINGDEASPYYAAGTAQYHINADIAFALGQYVRLTGDTDLLHRHGAELLVQTARMWASLGFFSDRRDGQFVIHGVTGPDEYSTVVDNNLFTNLMAAENLRSAADAVAALRSHDRDAYDQLVTRTALAPGEPERWRRAAEKMHIPHDDRAGVHLQDDGFLDREPWDFAGTSAEKYPLLLNYHPLVIYRHQVIKQADVVLASVLLPERFTAEQRRRIFAYYDPLTTGDSSLSECIQAIAAADAGKFRTAEEYLIDALAVDLADTAGNLRDGLHLASAAGTWMAVVYGFGGYRWRTRDFSPMLPTRAQRIRFPLRIGGSKLEVTIEPRQVTYTVHSGGPVTARHWGTTEFTAEAGRPVAFPGNYHTHDGSIDAR